MVQQLINTAIRDAVEENQRKTRLAISLMDPGRKKGFQSKNSCNQITSTNNGEVIDVEVITKCFLGSVQAGNKRVKLLKHKASC